MSPPRRSARRLLAARVGWGAPSPWRGGHRRSRPFGSGRQAAPHAVGPPGGSRPRAPAVAPARCRDQRAARPAPGGAGTPRTTTSGRPPRRTRGVGPSRRSTPRAGRSRPTATGRRRGRRRRAVGRWTAGSPRCASSCRPGRPWRQPTARAGRPRRPVAARPDPVAAVGEAAAVPSPPERSTTRRPRTRSRCLLARRAISITRHGTSHLSVRHSGWCATQPPTMVSVEPFRGS